MQLVRETYQTTKCWPAREQYGLTSQTRRAAASVPSNIAEGAGRGTGPDFARFVRTAIGSICEYETLVRIGTDLGYVSSVDSRHLLEEAVGIRSMLKRLELSLTGREYGSDMRLDSR